MPTYKVHSGVVTDDSLPAEVARFASPRAAQSYVRELLPLQGIAAHGFSISVVAVEEDGSERVLFDSATRGQLSNLIAGPLGREVLA